MRLLLLSFCCSLCLSTTSYAQAPKHATSSEIYHAVEKLNFLGSALFIAAHPDDENTRLISYMSNHEKARMGYLSMTRGDGGQNLIGPELRELLGVLRTEELLAARRMDGGEQFFTRANDFGYSKNPEETFKIWDKKEVLGDVVRLIRQFQPDVVINRFDYRTPGTTHGHHTASAILSFEAFDLVNDAKAYPEQLEMLTTWQPRRLFFNTTWWFYGSQEDFAKADKSNLLSFDVGAYYPILGISNNEIASLASSQHLCQGFGRLLVRGSQTEYVELLKGDMPKNKNNIFDGINTKWSRINGGEAIGKILEEVEANFNFTDPSVHLTQLLKAYQLLIALPEGHWRTLKKKELEDIILAVGGIYIEASATTSNTNLGAAVTVQIEAINRSNVDIELLSVAVNSEKKITEKHPLAPNEKVNLETTFKVPSNTKFTSPYWLNEKGSIGMYKVSDPSLIGKPETPRAFHAQFELDINGTIVTFEKDVVHRYAQNDRGERYDPFEVLPDATASFKDKVLIFSDGSPKQIPITVKAHKDNAKGEVVFRHSKGWTVDTESQTFNIQKKDDQQTLVFTLSPPANEDESFISPLIKIEGQEISKKLVEINYDHIPKQSVLLPSETKVVRLNIQKMGQDIGYIVGAGDDVPTSLEQIGYTVHFIDPLTITKGSLKKYDAVVTGIRAYNVVPELKFKQKYLLDYVENGGNLIIQYNTAGRWNNQFENIAPYPLTLSRDRVTDENSEVTIIATDNALVNFPNKIDESDFEGWVQERGLYFPKEWDAKFTPILSMHDAGESALEGSLLVASYGKGHYMYSGLSFFRELPAGVIGAYRLFANMLSLGKDKVETTDKVKG